MIIYILGWAAVLFIVAVSLISAGLALLRGYNIGHRHRRRGRRLRRHRRPLRRRRDAHGPYKPRQLVGEILILIDLVMVLPLFVLLFIVGLPVILKS